MFLFQCFIIIARRLEKKPKKKKNRESSSSSSSSSKARTFSFLYLYLGALYLSLQKSARIFYDDFFLRHFPKRGEEKNKQKKKKEEKSISDTLNVPHTQRGEKIGLLSGPHTQTEKRRHTTKPPPPLGRRRRRRRRNTHLFFLSLSSQSLFFGRRSKDPRSSW